VRRKKDILRLGVAPGAILIGAILIAGSAVGQDFKQLSRTARESVVQLRVDLGGGRESLGTGFAVHDGLIVTNHHVIDNALQIEAILASDEIFNVAGIVGTDEENDLAILKLDNAVLPPLPLAGDIVIEAGEQVVVLGNPLGFSGTLSEGIVSAVREQGFDPGGTGRSHDSPPQLQITAAISQGSSGSPVMTLEGKVIGVAVRSHTGGQNLNFAVPVAQVKKLLDRVDPNKLERSLSHGGSAVINRPWFWNLAISLLVFAALLIALRRLRT